VNEINARSGKIANTREKLFFQPSIAIIAYFSRGNEYVKAFNMKMFTNLPYFFKKFSAERRRFDFVVELFN
jgi:hypothetical protein